MRHLHTLLLTFVLLCAVFLNIIPSAMAAGGEIVFYGASQSFSFAPGSGYTATDLFSGFKNIMPGDHLTETITVNNRYRHAGAVKIYLKVEPHGFQNPLTYNEEFESADGKDQTAVPQQRDETAADMEVFLSKLILRIMNKDVLVCEDALSGSGGIQPVYLGTLKNKQSMDLTLELYVPLDLGNEYANRVGETDWIFTAEVFDDPNPNVPKTGDMILAVVMIMGISGLLFALILLTGRRKK